MTSETTSSINGDPTGVDQIARTAQDRLVTITGFVDSAKASAVTAAEHQAQIATVFADVQGKLTEIAAAAAQVAALKTQVADSSATASAAIAEFQGRADTALAEAK